LNFDGDKAITVCFQNRMKPKTSKRLLIIFHVRRISRHHL